MIGHQKNIKLNAVCVFFGKKEGKKRKNKIIKIIIL